MDDTMTYKIMARLYPAFAPLKQNVLKNLWLIICSKKHKIKKINIMVGLMV